MKKSFALAVYLFNNQRKNLNHMLFMFVIPIALYVYNSYRYGVTTNMLISFVAIAPIQMLLYQFGGTFVSHKQSGSLIKYQLMGFKPLQVMIGICISTLVFEILYVMGLMIVSIYLAQSVFFLSSMTRILGAFLILNLFEFALVILLTSYSNSFEQYNTFSTIAFYSQLMLLISVGTKIPLTAIVITMLLCLTVGVKNFKWHTM